MKVLKHLTFNEKNLFTPLLRYIRVHKDYQIPLILFLEYFNKFSFKLSLGSLYNFKQFDMI